MSPVELKKMSCRPVDFKGQGPNSMRMGRWVKFNDLGRWPQHDCVKFPGGGGGGTPV